MDTHLLHALLADLEPLRCGINAPPTPFAELSPDGEEILLAIARGDVEAASDSQRIEAILALPDRPGSRQRNEELFIELLHTAPPEAQLHALHRLDRDDHPSAVGEAVRLLADGETSPPVALVAAEIAAAAGAIEALPLIEELQHRWLAEAGDEASPSLVALEEIGTRLRDQD